MNGPSQLPQYTFDPVTQRYTLKTPAEQAREQQRGRSGLGALYDSGGANPAMSTPSSFSMSPETAVGMQNFGLAMQGVPSIAAQALGAVSSAVPSAFGYGTVSPVANPSPMAISEVAPDPAFANPTASLAAMNAQVAAQQAEAANQATVTNTATAIADAVTNAAAATDTAAAATDTAAAATEGGGYGGDNASPGDSPSDGGSSGEGGGSDGSVGLGGGFVKGGQVMNYEKGGLAAAAQSVQDKGRKGDSMLIHMSPEEVRGLQAIAMQHGGSLTINPETGLVEANFLRAILPMIAGAALNVAVPGLGAAMGGFAIPALVGGASYLMNPKQGLMGGIMAGLGAYGGMNLAGALTAPAVTGTQAGLQAVGQQALGTTALPPGVTAGGGAQASALMQQNIAMGMTPAEAAAQIAGSASYAPAAAANIPASIASPTAAQMAATNAAVPPQTMTQGLKSLIQDAPGSRAAFMKEVGGATGLATKVGGPLAAGMFSAEEPDEGGKKPQEYIRPYSFDFNRADADPEFKYRTGAPGESTAEQRYFTPEFKGLGVFKAGTEPGPSFYGKPTAEQLALYSKPKDSPLGLKAGGLAGLGRGGLRDGAFIIPADVVAHLGNGSNDAGQKILARGLGSRPIKGKGDGMSDSIPTSIEGKQPARVADGEAYIPPEVVKKVGSKRLYAMMDKIRQARTGTKKQAPEVNPRQFMPA